MCTYDECVHEIYMYMACVHTRYVYMGCVHGWDTNTEQPCTTLMLSNICEIPTPDKA